MTVRMDNSRPPAWWQLLSGYHWFVLTVAALGWLFDCLDQQLFVLARAPAMAELLGAQGMAVSPEIVTKYGGYATSIFMIGWATGGLIFGALGDRIGRARTMVLTIVLYSLFTGLSAFSGGFWDFAVYRFLTGLGVGGEFAVGVALVAEVLPAPARPHALGLLQALTTVGNISAALINMGLGALQSRGTIGGEGQWSAWRWMFLIGAAPAVLALVIRLRLKEPEPWKRARASAALRRSDFGSYGHLFRTAIWRRHAVVGMLLACSGVFALWGITFYSFELVRSLFRATFEAQGLSPALVEGQLKHWVGLSAIALNVGAFFGMLLFSQLAQRLGRRPAFAITYLASLISTGAVYLFLRSFHQVFWMFPIMGACVFALFAGYAIYLPELFPTNLRSTGTSFCYNVGRYVGAFAPTLLGLLTSEVFSDANGFKEGLRYAGLVMCGVFLLGLAVLPFAPETKDKPLPEEDPASTG